jgi:hypothetical protein
LIKNKKPAEVAIQRASNPFVLANSAPHTRRRAVRVMVLVMVPDQHELLSYVGPSRESIRKIRFCVFVSMI